jgi:hypothetical protein
MAVRAQKREILDRIIFPVSVDVLNLERNPACNGIPFIPTAARASLPQF